MEQDKRKKEIYKVTLVGSFINFLLVVFKFLAGMMGNSAAMIADAVHSLSDFATDMVVLFFVRISNKPQDKDHDYGHGKYETLATVIIAIVLFAVGVGIFWNGLKDVIHVFQGKELQAPGAVALWAALISIVGKEVAYRYTVFVGKKVKSSAVVANAWHHRSDAFSSIGTAIGIGGAILLGKQWHVLDPIAAVVVSIFIMKVSIDLLKPCVEELTEKSLPDEVENEIAEMVLNTPGVCQLHNLRTRRIGNHYALEMHIRMDGRTPLNEAHYKTCLIEQKLREKYGKETHLGIHAEPIKINGTYEKPEEENNI